MNYILYLCPASFILAQLNAGIFDHPERDWKSFALLRDISGLQSGDPGAGAYMADGAELQGRVADLWARLKDPKTYT